MTSAAPGRKAALAIQGGAPLRDRPWPAWPVYDEAEERALLETLREGEWGGYPMPNRRADRFATAFAGRHDCEHGLCVANGTVSLELALQAAGVEPGAEVIVPAYTFEATASAALFSGCVPVFADIDPHSYCLDPDSVEDRLTERTQAIIPVHLGMRCADLDRLCRIADRHGLALIEDCAHAHGARWRDRGIGSFGAAGSFSFQTSKLMTAGEGGIVVTNDTEVLDRLFALANCGRQRPERLRDHPVIGHNYRMTDLQAALLEVQLSRLDRQHEIRNRNAELLDLELERVGGLEPLSADDRVTHPVIYQYVVRYDSGAFDGLARESFVAALAAEGIPCDGRFYECLTSSELLPHDESRYPAWTGRVQDPCPNAEHAAWREGIWIPHPVLLGGSDDVAEIVAAIDKVRRHAADLHGFEHPRIDEQKATRAQRPGGSRRG